MTQTEALRLALEALEKSEPNKRKGDDDCREIGWMEHREAITAIKAALETKDAPCCYGGIAHDCHAGSGCRIAERLKTSSEAKDEPVAWKWHQAPVKTQWGHEMVVADIAIDKDHTASIYCERNQKTRVEVMFSTPPQRTWVGLTDEEVADIERNSITRRQAIRAIEAKLKDKNT